MWAGLRAALDVLAKSSSSSHSNSILLFSDGQVNAGEFVSTQSLLEKVRSDVVSEGKCALSALGVGDDFNEELMKGMADEGRGTYYYIQNAQDLSRFVESALHAFLSPFAYDAVLEITVPSSASPSSPSPRIDVVGHTNPSSIRLGDLIAENTRTVIAGVTFTPPHGQSAGPINVASITLTYRSLTGDTVRITQSLSLPVTADSSVHELGINKAALARVLMARTARRDEEIYEHLRYGRAEEAERESEMLLQELGMASQLADEVEEEEKRERRRKER